MKAIDERVIQARQKINSNAFGYALMGLWGILCFRMFILHQTSNEYSDILLLTIGLSAYILIANIRSGVYSNTPRKSKSKLIICLQDLLYIALFTLAFRFLTGIESIPKLLIATFIAIVIKYSPILFAQLSNWMINKKLEND